MLSFSFLVTLKFPLLLVGMGMTMVGTRASLLHIISDGHVVGFVNCTKFCVLFYLIVQSAKE